MSIIISNNYYFPIINIIITVMFLHYYLPLYNTIIYYYITLAIMMSEFRVRLEITNLNLSRRVIKSILHMHMTVSKGESQIWVARAGY